MDNEPKRNLIAALIPDELEAALGMKPAEGGEDPDQEGMLGQLLGSLGGQAEGEQAGVFKEFLKGEGGLFALAGEALARSPRSAEKEIAKFLEDKLGLNKTAAGLAAKVVLRLFPGIKSALGGGEKPKPRPRPSSTSKTKPKKKPATAKAKKEGGSTTAAKAKKKPAPAKKKPTPRKRPTRGAEVDGERS